MQIVALNNRYNDDYVSKKCVKRSTGKQQYE